MKEKIKLTFLRLFDKPLSKYLVSERIYLLHAMTVLAYLAKLKRDLELPFGEHFGYDFSIKMFCV